MTTAVSAPPLLVRARRDVVRRRIALLEQVVPEMHGLGQRLLLTGAGRLDRDRELARRRAQHGRQELRRELPGRDQRGLGAHIVEDVLVIGDGVRRVGRHRDRAQREDRDLGDAPLGPVLHRDDDAVARRHAERRQAPREPAHRIARLAPRKRLPRPAALGPEERLIAKLRGAREEQRRQIAGGVDLRRPVPLGHSRPPSSVSFGTERVVEPQRHRDTEKAACAHGAPEKNPLCLCASVVNFPCGAALRGLELAVPRPISGERNRVGANYGTGGVAQE